jgi:hypothetical protein
MSKIAKAAYDLTRPYLNTSHEEVYFSGKLFVDNISEKCNIEKSFKDKAIRTDYEAFDRMHIADGIVNKSLSPSKL